MTGQKLLHYQILEKLGEGGMGVVYKARDTRLNRFVALKLLALHEGINPERRRRFAQEARAASSLNHPNIVAIHDINEADGAEFICMEYVAGKTLDQLTPRHGLPLNQALQYAVQVADALAQAHAAGVVHRDLKPSNIMVDQHGLVKVLDFGLAKLMEPGPHDEDEVTRTLEVRTQEGKVAGTPAYMSPEQVDGKPVDARSDIFSYGSLLYEMLSGQSAFRRDSAAATMAAVLREEPKPLGEVATEIPHQIERIVKSCLRKDPGRRLQHMDDVKAMLLNLKEDSESGVLDRILPQKRSHVGRWVAALSALVAIAAGAILLRGWRTTDPAYRPEPVTAMRGWEQDPSLSPEGNQVAYAWNGGKEDNLHIYVKLIGEGLPVPITNGSAEDVSPAWGPDGNTIAFLRKRSDRLDLMTVVMIRNQSQERKLAELASKASYRDFPNRELAWSPDGRYLVFYDEPSGGKPGLFALSLKDRQRHQVTALPKGQLRDSDPSFSPDGRTLAFVRIRNFSFSDLYLLPLTEDVRAAGEAKQIGMQFQRKWGRHSISQPAWTPDGRNIVFVADSSELWKMSKTGNGAERLGIGEADQVDISRKAPYRLVYHAPEKASSLSQLDLSKKGPAVPFAPTTRVDTSPQYSPDGKRVLFASNRDNNRFDIWVCSANGIGAHRLTDLGAPETGSPRWFPDSRHAVFDSNKDGSFQIYTIDVDDIGTPKPLTFDQGDNNMPSVSEDGKTIYFSSRRGGSLQVWRLRADGSGAAERVTTHGGYGPMEARGFLYFLRGEGGAQDEIWRIRLSDSSEAKVLSSVAGRRYAVRSDGNGLYYYEASATGESIALQYFDFSSQGKQRIAVLKGRFQSFNFGLTVSPSGRSVLYSITEHPTSNLMFVNNFH